jgi:hypothetical protein
VSDYAGWWLDSTESAECPDCDQRVNVGTSELEKLLDAIDAHECDL